MPGKRLFEYAVIRVVPRVEREEFLNVGVVLFCKEAGYLKIRHHVDQRRLSVLCAAADCDEVAEHMNAFERIAGGDPSGGQIASMDTAGRFRWLTATRSTVVQTSRVHPGLCDDPDVMLDTLFRQLVLD